MDDRDPGTAALPAWKSALAPPSPALHPPWFPSALPRSSSGSAWRSNPHGLLPSLTAPLTLFSLTSPEAAPKPSAKSIYEQRKRYSTVVMADVSQYPVNHLVTFCLGEEDGVHTVEDASRRLAVMDTQGRVWAQEMSLRVSPGHVTLLDPTSKEELESYPLGAIVRCDAVTLPGRTRALLLLVCQEPERTQPDVHFFQGLRLGAELIREDIQGALHYHRSGRGERRTAALRATQEELQRRPAPAAETPPLQRRLSIRAVISTVEPGRGRPQAEPIPEAEESLRPPPGPAGTSGSAAPASPDLGPRGPDLASLQAEREVDILNHVFEDVESFVAKLQKSAEATRVLEHRERGRRTRRRAAGEGLLALRAKPPSEAEYTDVLQKIKYAFSLLARLRGNIANPSSPELLHFLFGPLQLIVDTSGGPRFASEVQQPHLTSEAVALLRDNLTPRENALWTSLGDSWTRPGGPSRPAPGPRGPELPLSPRSEASEVRAWLQAKGFGAGTVAALGVLTGAQLFSLEKEELRAVSPDEGARVYSQVTVQRALLEDKVSELEAVMEKQKKKVEGDTEMEVI
ncbi:epidermal growth factor receptor kinase substrate 8-like protein 1 [Suricata suricatta]|uniref:epidermal growth factor receptor kinase substrate 8-like protein 1 n=1 Tax=Suricata suricatta TaxID=37032 RepID=UPI0011555E34|nr:epidermal growth factor receptor kinase substrate 8-like protein 1 [Suricata suricatta]